MNFSKFAAVMARSADGAVAASVAALLYLNALPGGFVFDDHRAIERNGCVAAAGAGCASLLSTDFWGTPLDSPRSHRSYRPLSVLSLRLNAQLGASAAGFHAANALLHAAVTWLLWSHAAATLRRRPAALAAALLFAAHPANTEAVAYCVGRADLLAAALGLGGLRLHARATSAAAARRSAVAVAALRLGACACLALALAAKETAVVLLPACAVFDVLAPRRRARRALASVAPGWLLLALLALGFGAVRRWVVGPIGRTAEGAPSFRRLDNPLAFEHGLARALSTARVHAAGLSLLLWPRTLSADYSFDALPAVRALADAANAPAAVLYAGLLAAAAGLVRGGHRAPLAWLLLLLLAYAPASHVLVPLSFVVAERLLYVPCAAACVLAGAALAPPRRRGRRRGAAPAGRAAALGRRLGRAALACALVAAGARTMARNLDWRSDATIFGAAAEAYPRSAKAAYQLADGLVQAGRAADAVPLFQRVLSIEPDYHYAYLHLARLALTAGEHASAASLAEASLRAVPSPNPHGHALAARALLALRPSDGAAARPARAAAGERAARAVEHARAAIAADPGAPDAPSHMSTLGEALSRAGRWAEAAGAFERVASLRPEEEGSARVNVGAAMLQLGRAPEALGHFRRALALAAAPPTGRSAEARAAAAAIAAGVVERAERGLRAAAKAAG